VSRSGSIISADHIRTTASADAQQSRWKGARHLLMKTQPRGVSAVSGQFWIAAGSASYRKCLLFNPCRPVRARAIVVPGGTSSAG
jgi:hypothetical protein